MSERNYKKEYLDYQGTPQQKKRRAMRNAARRRMVREGRARKGDGKDVDHKNGDPMDNSPRNLRVMSRSRNRAKK
jgi:hypothetical protein